ncbi:hypothetical protein F8388_017873 [Cannabis sativa]|uniref:Uncharacterized protein n=1 Tax=Cannabis sativa TaxID=3483 RepID=A0A7J6F3K8_CANSA|nr:hypothetical protein F8388_017873 [Cannabis sativa]
MLSTQFESINPVFRVGIRFRRDGFFDYNPNICCGGHNCISSGQNLLQQNPFHQFASPDIGYHSSSMLLDDYALLAATTLLFNNNDHHAQKMIMWAIVYLAQMKPLIVPILSEGECNGYPMGILPVG